jgi:hypothetical protein
LNSAEAPVQEEYDPEDPDVKDMFNGRVPRKKKNTGEKQKSVSELVQERALEAKAVLQSTEHKHRMKGATGGTELHMRYNDERQRFAMKKMRRDHSKLKEMVRNGKAAERADEKEDRLMMSILESVGLGGSKAAEVADKEVEPTKKPYVPIRNYG